MFQEIVANLMVFVVLLQDEEVAAAEAFEEFVAAFEDTTKRGKTFIRGSTFNAGTRGGVTLIARPRPITNSSKSFCLYY